LASSQISEKRLNPKERPELSALSPDTHLSSHGPALKSATLQWVSLSVILLAGFALRVMRLDTLPALLSRDESINGLDAVLLWHTQRLTPFLQNNFGRETLFFYVQGAFLKLFGISIFSLRYVSVLFGLLTIPLLYLLGRLLLRRMHQEKTQPEINPTVVGLLAAAGIAVSYWHIYYSRLALRAVALLPLLLFLLLCFWRGWNSTDLHQRRRRFLSSGFLLGISFYTYLAARLLPFVFFAFFLLQMIQESTDLRRRLSDLVTFYGAAAVASLPLIAYFWHNPQALSGRTGAISILTAANPWQELGQNVLDLLAVQFAFGTWLDNWPALPLLSAVGLVLGLAYCLRHIRRPQWQLLLLWWLSGWVPVLLSQQRWDQETTILRGIIAWPAVFLLSAIGLTALVTWSIRWWSRHTAKTNLTSAVRYAAALLPLGLLLANGIWVRGAYFSHFAEGQPTSQREQVLTLVEFFNRRTGNAVMLPNIRFANSMTRFLLQSSYPNLDSLDPTDVCTQLNIAGQNLNGVQIALPPDSTSHSAYSLLYAQPGEQGTAYLLPRLTRQQVEEVEDLARRSDPQAILTDTQDREVMRLYALPPDLNKHLCEAREMDEVQVDFDSKVRLTGYHIDPPTVSPGESFTLSLRWQALQPTSGDCDLFVHAFGTDGQRIAQINVSLGNTMLLNNHWWPTGREIWEYHRLQVPDTAADGPYRFEIGLYHRSSLRRLPVSVGPDVDTLDGSIVIGKLLVQSAPPSSPQLPLDLEFEEDISLIGADVSSTGDGFAPGSTIDVTLHWQADDPITEDYTVFTHLINSDGDIVSQHDSMPHGNLYPTSLWSPGEIVLDSHPISLAPGLPPGAYQLHAGLYLLQTGERIPLVDSGADYATLGDILVTSQQ
jgi:4-amino-4-deoxy-L-arabinose transferase-like glycosyltransferase